MLSKLLNVYLSLSTDTACCYECLTNLIDRSWSREPLRATNLKGCQPRSRPPKEKARSVEVGKHVTSLFSVFQAFRKNVVCQIFHDVLNYLSCFLLNIESTNKQKECIVHMLYLMAKGIYKNGPEIHMFSFPKDCRGHVIW